ncbi:hypothetical protein EXIGLDRAFT_834094 [Exidia glandulosa HHB12029]|uniref:Peroxin-3 n=1 Tax=Exidia glandulosa HHB12029 TaxID=1314781 RepID=A0A166AWP6_EXIGL|nr:hypothetical protein EXIGLDRAFT_834094 [Exidia glandulosa HHB12029]
MLASIRKFVYDRRRGLALTAGIAGSVYLAGRYVLARLEEIRDKVMQDRAARDNLRRRFVKNQEDIAFTVLALLPPLGTHVLEAMDVERLTLDLKNLSSSRSSSAPLLDVPIPASTNLDDDARSEASSSAVGDTAQSWVDQFNSQSTASLGVEQQDVGSSTVQLNIPHHSSTGSGNVESASVDSPRSTDLSMSGSMLSEQSEASSVSSSSTTARSKADLWRDVKITTFARTLTIAYSTTLLTLLTHIQLSLLGRHKYVASVRALDRESQAVFGAASSAMLFDFTLPQSQQEQEDKDNEEEDEPELTEEIERRYLTLSWWLLNEGWREVASRVRGAVESVFDPVSLKTQLSIDDLALLIRAVRSRIETHDNFLPALLPPTQSDLARVLGASTTFATSTSSSEALLHDLLSETRTRLASADFTLVLRAALEASAEGTLLASLERELFQPETGEDAEHQLQSAFGPPLGSSSRRRTVRLASLLPGVARWAHGALGGYPNELVDAVAGLHEVEVFSAIVYSAYDDELVAGA